MKLKSPQTCHRSKVMATYRHAIQRQLAMNFELVGRGHSTAGVHQTIAELDGKAVKHEHPRSRFWVVLAKVAGISYQEEHSLLEALP